jgi:YbbR domain-containing protein
MEKRGIHIIVATTLSAILLWVSVNMSYEYQIAVTVPLMIENLPADKAMATALPKSVQLKLRGNGWRSAALILGSDPRCVLDVSSPPMTKRGLALNDIVDRITMPPGIQPVDMKPESVFIGLDSYAQKRVPVTLHATTEFRAGYGQVGPITIAPESITVGGAASLLPAISSWPTSSTIFADLKSAIDAEVPLVDSASQYLTLYPQVVHVRIDVQQFAEKTVTGLLVETQTVPYHKEVILIPPKIDIVVRGGIQQLATLSNDSFRVIIDYSDIIADSTGYADPLVIVPQGVQLVNKKPNRMQFVVRTRL